jgi:hypothetical protein
LVCTAPAKRYFYTVFAIMLLLYMYQFIISDISPSVGVKGPDGLALLIAIGILLVFPVIYFLYWYFRKSKNKTTTSQPFWSRKRVVIELQKDRKYYPDFIKMTVRNTGKSDVDLDQPLLIFRNFWTKRKFKLKGTSRYSFYPLLLEPGRKHDLTIDLNHFYRHDKRLKKYPRITLVVSDVNGKKFAPQSIMLRKTLFR